MVALLSERSDAALDAGRSRLGGTAWRLRSPPLARVFTGAGGFAAVVWIAIGAVLLYRAGGAPLYNPTGSIDPWGYRSLMSSFDSSYRLFSSLYYGSRLPFVIPGYAASLVLPPLDADLAFHAALALGSLLALYQAVRRPFGRGAALVAVVALAANPAFYDSSYWDNWDGAVDTFLLATTAFAVTSASGRWRPLSLGLAGFFGAAAFFTNFSTAFYLAGIAILWLAVNLERPLGAFPRRLAADAGAAVAGGALLFVLCGIFAASHGASFFFAEPQLKAAGTIDWGFYRMPGSAWMLREPKLLVPPVLAVVVGLVALRARRDWAADRALRLAGASGVALLLVWTIAFAVDRAGGPALLQVQYYAVIVPFVALALAALTYLLAVRPGSIRHRTLVLLAAAGAATLPLLVLYVGHWTRFITSRPLVPAAALAALVLAAAALLLRRAPAWPLPALALALSLLFASYGFGASWTTYENGTGGASNATTFRLGLDLTRYLHAHRYDVPMPAFWYRDDPAVPYVRGIQSFYFYRETAVGIEMPTLDPSTLQRLRALAPRRLVLLCVTPGCAGAQAALARAHFRFGRERQHLLAEGDERVWVMVLARRA